MGAVLSTVMNPPAVPFRRPMAIRQAAAVSDLAKGPFCGLDQGVTPHTLWFQSRRGWDGISAPENKSGLGKEKHLAVSRAEVKRL